MFAVNVEVEAHTTLEEIIEQMGETGTSMSQGRTSHARASSFPVVTGLPQQEGDPELRRSPATLAKHFPLLRLRVRTGGKTKLWSS